MSERAGGDTSAVRAWIAGRTPPPPASLVARVASLYVDTAPDSPRTAPVQAAGCVDAAERVVGCLIADGATSRASALDLLAADALATYAFEVASDDPATLGALADAAMRRFAALASPGAARTHRTQSH